MSQHNTKAGGNFVRLLGILRPHSPAILLGVVLTLVLSGLNLCLPWAPKIAIDRVFPAGDTQLLMLLLSALGLVYLVRNTLYFCSRWAIAHVAEKIGMGLRRRVCEHLHVISLEVVKRLDPGNVLARATSDVGAVQELIDKGLLTFVVNAFTLLGALVVIFCLNPLLALVATVVLPVHVFFYLRFRAFIMDAAKRSKAQAASVTAKLLELMAGPELVKSSGAEQRETGQFGDRLSEAMRLNLRARSLHLWQRVVADVLAGAGVVAVFGYGAVLVLSPNSGFSAGAFIAFYSYVVMMYVLVVKLAAQTGYISATLASVERIFELLDLSADVTEAAQAVVLKRIVGEIELRDVSFEYAGTHQGVRRVSFRAKAGDKVAVVGPSGAGKSTLAKLLARMYDAGDGRILIDGVDIAELKLGPFRDQVAIVFQETVLFDGSVMDNIRYARPEATDDEVIHAAKTAQAHDFIKALPHGYDTRVGPQGQDFSTGQKQRIGLARAVLKDPAVLILDEAASAIDLPTRRKIWESLGRLLKDRTTFVITHDPAVMRQADLVVALQEGEIRQTGRFEDVVGDHTEQTDYLGGQMLL